MLEELATIQPELDDLAQSTARALGVLIAAYGDRPHRHLWFIGD